MSKSFTLFSEALAADARSVIYNFLTPEELTITSGISQDFRNKSRSAIAWKKRLISLGCNRAALNEIIKAGVVANYPRLYKALTTISPRGRINISAIHLCYLSGEPKAIQYAGAFILNRKDGRALMYTARAGSAEGMKLAVSAGISKWSAPHEGENALLSAAYSGDIKAMQLALSWGLDAHSVDVIGANILHYTAMGGSKKAMEFALSLGIDPKSVTQGGMTVVDYAVQSNSLVAMMFAQELVGEVERTILCSAAYGGSIVGIRFAYSAQSDPNLKGFKGCNVLHQAVVSQELAAMEEAKRLLLAKGVALNSPDHEHGMNIVHYAARTGLFRVVQWTMRQEGIALTDTTPYGENVLHFAAEAKSDECLKKLLRKKKKLKLSVESADRWGCNILHRAAQGGSVKNMKLAVKCGLNFRQVDNSGKNIFHQVAAFSHSIDAAAYAVGLGIDPNSVTLRGDNALHLSLKDGLVSLEFVTYLLCQGLDLMSTSNMGNALHLASMSGLIEAIRFLRCLAKELGVDLDHKKNSWGNNAYQAAVNFTKTTKKALSDPLKKIHRKSYDHLIQRIVLYKRIEEMKKYGESLKAEGLGKGDKVIELAQKLKMETDKFFYPFPGKQPAKPDNFARTFSTLLHSLDNDMVHRAYWKVVVANIALAFTGLGLLLVVGKLVYSKYKTGNWALFFEQTRGQRQIEKTQAAAECLETTIKASLVS